MTRPTLPTFSTAGVAACTAPYVGVHYGSGPYYALLARGYVDTRPVGDVTGWPVMVAPGATFLDGYEARQ